MRFSYGSVGFNDRDLEAALAAIAAAGFDLTEVMGKEPHVGTPLSGRALVELRQYIQASGVSAASVHAPMRHNVLGPPDEDWRRAKVPVFKQYLQFTAAIEATDMIVHPVPNPMFVEDPERPGIGDAMYEAVRRSLDELMPVLEQTGVRILLENLPYQCSFPLLTVGELDAFVDPYPKACVGLVFDTGHAGAMQLDPAAEIRASGNRLWGTHLEDIRWGEGIDNHWIPTHGSLDWEVILAALREVDYRGVLTFEVINGRNDESREELARLSRAVASQWQTQIENRLVQPPIPDSQGPGAPP